MITLIYTFVIWFLLYCGVVVKSTIKNIVQHYFHRILRRSTLAAFGWMDKLPLAASRCRFTVICLVKNFQDKHDFLKLITEHTDY